MKRMNGRRRRARGRQYDSLRNSWPSPHCVVVFYTYLHLDSFIYCLFELFSFLENRRVLSPLSLLPRSNSSLHLLFQRLRYTYHGICRLCHFLSISDTILLIFTCQTTRILSILLSSSRINCIYFLDFFFKDHFNSDFIIFWTTTEHCKRVLVGTKPGLVSNQLFGVSTICFCHSRGLTRYPIFMTFSLNNPRPLFRLI